MQPTDTDRDEGVLPSSTGIDRSIGYLAIGLVVAMFFCLTIFGMTRMEKISNDAMESAARPQNAPAPTSEIGGAGTETPR